MYSRFAQLLPMPGTTGAMSSPLSFPAVHLQMDHSRASGPAHQLHVDCGVRLRQHSSRLHRHQLGARWLSCLRLAAWRHFEEFRDAARCLAERSPRGGRGPRFNVAAVDGRLKRGVAGCAAPVPA